MKRSGDPFTDGILSTPLESIIGKIDDFIPGFYALFDYRFSLRYRIANLVLGDNLRWFLIAIGELCEHVESYPDEIGRKRLSLWVKKVRRGIGSLQGREAVK